MLEGIAEWFIGLLPEWTPSLPSSPGVAENLQRVDSVIPIIGPLRVVATLASFLVVFMLIRAVVFLRHLLLP